MKKFMETCQRRSRLITTTKNALGSGVPGLTGRRNPRHIVSLDDGHIIFLLAGRWLCAVLRALTENSSVAALNVDGDTEHYYVVVALGNCCIDKPDRYSYRVEERTTSKIFKTRLPLTLVCNRYRLAYFSYDRIT